MRAEDTTKVSNLSRSLSAETQLSFSLGAFHCSHQDFVYQPPPHSCRENTGMVRGKRAESSVL